MTIRDQLLSLVQFVFTGSTDDAMISDTLDELEDTLPHGDFSDLIFQDMRNLTPEQVVDEAIRREADHNKTVTKTDKAR